MSNKIIKKATACGLSAVMAFGLMVVTDAPKTATVNAATKKVKKLSFKKKGYVIKKKGRKMNMRVCLKFSPKTSKTTKVVYKTSNKKIATISKKGILKAKKKGTVTITAIAKNNKKAKATTTVTVGKVVKSLKFKQGTKKTIIVGKTLKLTPKYGPHNASTKAVTYKSSNKKIATVTSKGVVKAKKEGSVKITATAKDAGKKKTTIKIIVKKAVTSAVTTKEVTLKPVKSGSTVTISGIDPNAESYTVIRKGKIVKFTAAEVKEALGYIANPASAYDTWLNTTSRMKAYVKVTGTKGSATKIVEISNTGTKYDGSYNVTVTKEANGYKVLASNKAGVKKTINVTIAANGNITAESTEYVVTSDKDATAVVATNKETGKTAILKKENGTYTITLPADKASDLQIVQEVKVN